VKFHDGTSLNAAAVKFTIDRAFNEKPGARWASLAGPFTGAEMVDDLTVDIGTKEPYGPALRSLAMAYVGIVSPVAVKKHGENYGRNPVGTGPSSSWSGGPTPASHREEQRLLGRQGPGGPRGLQGRARGRRPHDLVANGRSGHGPDPVAG
jgi:hypothetical protein